jgi:hypothetical protein
MASKIEVLKTVAAKALKAEPKKAAAPKAEPKKADKPEAAPKPTAAPKAEPKKAAANTFALHLNKTGRLCIGKEAAARLGENQYCLLMIEGKTVRLEPKAKPVDGAIEVKYADSEYALRPYISASKAWKALGWTGAEGIDIEAKPYGSSGFEFRL